MHNTHTRHKAQLVVLAAVSLMFAGGPVSGQVPAVEQITITANGIAYNAQAAGPEGGPLVVMLHGSAESSDNVRNQIHGLAKLGYRVVAADRQSFSPHTPDSPASPSMEVLIADVAAIADALRASRFHLVGHGWGGAVAWRFATQYPNRLCSLTVLSTPHPAVVAALQMSHPGTRQEPQVAAAIRVPTLYVWSTEDGTFSRDAAEATRAFVKAPFRFVVLRGIGLEAGGTAAGRITQLIAEQAEAFGDTASDNYRQAKATVDEAAASVGTLARGGAAGLSGRITGTTINRGQSQTPAPPFDITPLSGDFSFENAGRIRASIDTRNPGGTDRSYHQVFGEASGWNLWQARRQMTQLSPQDVARLRVTPTSNIALLFAHNYLVDAMAHGESLRWLGWRDVDGRSERQVAFTARHGRTVTLSVGRTGLPAQVEWMISDPRLGDVPQRVSFSNYQDVEGVKMAHHVRVSVGEEVVAEWEFHDLALVTTFPDHFFDAPQIEETPGPPLFQPQRIADGVWAVRVYAGPANSYTSLLVELDQGFVLVEPVLSDLLAQPVASIASTLSAGKPIRWVIATHHHADHLAGIRGYLRDGAVLLSTPDAVTVTQQMANADTTLGHNPVTGVDISGSMVGVLKRVTIGSGDRRLEVFTTLPTTHARQMLLVYVPHAKTIYVADLFAIPESGIFPSSALTLEFSRTIAELGLDVQHIVPTHGVVGTRADLDRAVGGGHTF